PAARRLRSGPAHRVRPPRRRRVLLDEEDDRDRYLEMLALTVLPVFIAICLAVYALVGSAEEKATIRESLRNLAGFEIDNERDRELLDPLRQRAIAPVVSWFTGLGRRLTPIGYVDGIRR